MKARLPQGYGKQNPNELMKQVQQMQDQMQEKQAELEETEYSVKGSGGLVEIVMRGDYNVVGVKIQPDAVDPDDIEMLEDLVAAAVNEAVRTVKDTAEEELGKISSSLNLPNIPGLNL